MYLSSSRARDGCHSKIMEYGKATSIVRLYRWHVFCFAVGGARKNALKLNKLTLGFLPQTRIFPYENPQSHEMPLQIWSFTLAATSAPSSSHTQPSIGGCRNASSTRFPVSERGFRCACSGQLPLGSPAQTGGGGGGVVRQDTGCMSDRGNLWVRIDGRP